jgi:hypothetical protein
MWGDMERDLLDILIIGENKQRCCHLVRALEQLKCRCWFASTAEEIRAVLDRRNFPLVLSTRPVTEGSALMLLLCRPERSVFYSVPVENSYLWFRAFPEVVAGKRLSSVRAGAFARFLTDLIPRLKAPKRSISTSLSTALFNPTPRAAPKNQVEQNENATRQSI